jgi:YD repeat-containing protein
MQVHLSLLLTIISFSSLSAEDCFEHIDDKHNSSSEMSVSPMVNGCVNAITGDFVHHALDLYIPGPEPLVLERSYISSSYHKGSLCNGWSHNHSHILSFEVTPVTDENFKKTGKECVIVNYLEPSGRGAEFSTYDYDKNHTTKLSYEHIEKQKGFTNCGDGVISARNSSKNTSIHFSRKKLTASVKTESGSDTTFDLISSSSDEGLFAFGQVQEKRPTGNIYNFEFDKKARTKKIIFQDSSGKTIFGNFEFERENFSRNSVKANDGREVVYEFDKFKYKYAGDKVKKCFISYVNPPNSLPEHFCYTDDDYYPKICRRTIGRSTCLDIEYFTRLSDNFYGRKIDLEKEPYLKNRVKALFARVGTDSTPHITHRFSYFSDTKYGHTGGYTHVYDAYDYKTEYAYNKDHHLTSIRKYTDAKNPQVYSTEYFIWSRDPNQYGFLLGKYFTDDKENIHHARLFEYDNAGNIITDTVYGNITGKNQKIQMVDQKIDRKTCDHFQKRYKYTTLDVKHLVEEETDDSGKTTRFTYYPGTDLVASKLVYGDQGTVIREFYEYDTHAILIKKTIDNESTELNGTSTVTEKRITNITPRKAYPFGLPEIVEEKYFDFSSNQEKLLKKTVYTHNSLGKVLSEEVFDANGNFAYKLEWENDRYGNICEQVDVLGNVIQMTYDLNGNLSTETHVNQNRIFVHEYDFSNRRIKTKETHFEDSKEKHFIRLWSYDLKGNCLSETDAFGCTTYYEYDEFNRVKSITNPNISSIDLQALFAKNNTTRSLTNSISQGYDILGNLTSVVDQCNHHTEKSYNMYGKPLSIFYPDGSEELFSYRLDGTLERAVATNKTYTKHTYDCFGRLLRKELFSANGTKLSSLSNTYDAFHLISSTDPMGDITYYKYDGAGRLVSTSKN